MNCKNHPEVEAIHRCTGCAEAFCNNCLVEIKGENYCSECKQMAFSDSGGGAEGTIPNEDAKKALQYAIIGIFCFGMVMGPMAISKGIAAKKAIEQDPRLDGSGKATAAIIIGVVVFVLWVIGIISRLSTL